MNLVNHVEVDGREFLINTEQIGGTYATVVFEIVNGIMDWLDRHWSTTYKEQDARDRHYLIVESLRNHDFTYGVDSEFKDEYAIIFDWERQ